MSLTNDCISYSIKAVQHQCALFIVNFLQPFVALFSIRASDPHSSSSPLAATMPSAMQPPTIPDEHLKLLFHALCGQKVAAKLQHGHAMKKAFNTDANRCMKFIRANIMHPQQPTLAQLVNCVFIYKELDTNFWDVVYADHLVALWAAHLFVCLQDYIFVFWMRHTYLFQYATYIADLDSSCVFSGLLFPAVALALSTLAIYMYHDCVLYEYVARYDTHIHILSPNI